MPTFQQVANSTEGKYAVTYKDASSGVWGVFATVYTTEAEATQQATTLITNGSASLARVCPPVGLLFQAAA